MRIHTGCTYFLYDFILFYFDSLRRSRKREMGKMVNSQKIFYALAMSLYSIDIKYVTQIRLGRLLPE